MDTAEANPSQFPAELHKPKCVSAAAPTDDRYQLGDEAPVVKGKVHQFYLVKLHPYEDPVLASKIKTAYGVLRTMNETRPPFVEDFEFRKMDRDKVRSDMEWHRHLIRGGWSSEEHYLKRDLDHFRQSLHTLSSSNKEWETHVKELKRRFVHERPNQAKERKICKDLTHLLQTKEDIDCAQAEEKAKMMQRYGSSDEIRQQIERIKIDLKASAKRRKEDAYDYTALLRQKAAIEKDLLAFKAQRVDRNKEKAKAHKCIVSSNRIQATIRADYDEYVETLNAAKELAMNKDLIGVEGLVNRANERFMSKWKHEKGFRDLYKKRVASSLDSRGRSSEGKLKSSGEDVHEVRMSDA